MLRLVSFHMPKRKARAVSFSVLQRRKIERNKLSNRPTNKEYQYIKAIDCFSRKKSIINLELYYLLQL